MGGLLLRWNVAAIAIKIWRRGLSVDVGDNGITVDIVSIGEIVTLKQVSNYPVATSKGAVT